MKVPYTKSGKCGNLVWQRARYGQICYPAFVPYNPRSPAQVAIRGILAAVSKRWGALAQQQRDAWIAVARTKWSKPRLTKGRLTGHQFFVQTNVPLAHRGQPQVDLPLEYLRSPKPDAASPFGLSRFDQLPVGPLLFLQARQIIGDWQHAPRGSPALAPAAAG